jgi:hypothetical protein
MNLQIHHVISDMGNRWLKRALTEASWAATREKDSYLAACIGVWPATRKETGDHCGGARTILEARWQILKEEVDYKELGGNYFERLNEQKTTIYLVKRLEKLGYKVQLTASKAAA